MLQKIIIRLYFFVEEPVGLQLLDPWHRPGASRLEGELLLVDDVVGHLRDLDLHRLGSALEESGDRHLHYYLLNL